MSQSNAIKFKIPNACHQRWDEMTSAGENRFCERCQKTVVDFTSWSDTALYNYFSKNRGRVCGRFLATQVGRPINIPHQPHSRLYRLAITLGLTITFTQTPHLSAQVRPPKTSHNIGQQLPVKSGGKITGIILNERKEPARNVTVQAFQNSVLKGSSMTDHDGSYLIRLASGIYDVITSMEGYDTVQVARVIVIDHKRAIVNYTLTRVLANAAPIKRVRTHRQPLEISEPPTELPDRVIITGEVTTESATQECNDTDSKKNSRRKNKNH